MHQLVASIVYISLVQMIVAAVATMKKLNIVSLAAVLLHFFLSSSWIQLGISQTGMSHFITIITGGEP